MPDLKLSVTLTDTVHRAVQREAGALKATPEQVLERAALSHAESIAEKLRQDVVSSAPLVLQKATDQELIDFLTKFEEIIAR